MSAQKKLPMTPWQRVYARFGLDNQAEFARLLGCDRSKVNRALDDDEGLINGRDQKRILEIARKNRVRVEPADMLRGA